MKLNESDILSIDKEELVIRDGLTKFYYENGQLQSESNYKDGQPTTPINYK